VSNRRHRIGLSMLRTQGTRNHASFILTIPAAIGLPAHLLGTAFSCELTQEGILFRPAIDGRLPAPELPAWAKNGSTVLDPRD